MLRPTHAEASEPGISMAITLLVISQMFYKLDAQQCIFRGEYSIHGMMLKGHTFIEEKTRIWLNCLDKCDDDVRCQSFNYVISQGICELNNRTKEARPEDFVPGSDRFYIKRFRERVPLGSVLELPAESCAEIRAGEGEDAVSGNYWFDSIKPGEVVLARCDMSKLDIDDCASHPCKNNATCTDRVNGFNCSCAPGFNGTLCETNIDDCTSHPCKNNGTCTDRVDGFNCSCAPGFNGTQCETDIDDCAGHPCKNNGTCTDRANGFNCSCAPGFNGTQCETDIDECTAQVNPCDAVANSECNNTNGSYSCQCRDGFVRNDSNCDDVDECAQGDPCDTVANSECKNTNGSYNCQCNDGYAKNGDNCEVDPCQTYDTFNASDRNLAHAHQSQFFWDCTPQFQHGWYRFIGDAGTRLPTQCPQIQSQPYPVWLNVQHNKLPHEGEGVKGGIYVCLPQPNSDCCQSGDFDFKISVKNCSSYLVYKLYRIPTCPYSYYGTN